MKWPAGKGFGGGWELSGLEALREVNRGIHTEVEGRFERAVSEDGGGEEGFGLVPTPCVLAISSHG